MIDHDKAAEHGYDLTLVSDRSVGRVSWAHVDGAILVDAMMEDPVVKSLLTTSLPVVTAGRVAGFPARRASGTVEIEHAKKCREILDAMASRGAKHVALISPEPGDEYSWARQIVAGYKRWCASRRLRPVLEVVHSFPTNAELEASLSEALSDTSVDSLLFGWQDVALRAEAALTRSGNPRGRDVKLASLLSSQDNLNDSFLAGLDLRPYEFGQTTAELLCNSVTKPPAPPIHRIHTASVVFPGGRDT